LLAVRVQDAKTQESKDCEEICALLPTSTAASCDARLQDLHVFSHVVSTCAWNRNTQAFHMDRCATSNKRSRVRLNRLASRARRQAARLAANNNLVREAVSGKAKLRANSRRLQVPSQAAWLLATSRPPRAPARTNAAIRAFLGRRHASSHAERASNAERRTSAPRPRRSTSSLQRAQSLAVSSRVTVCRHAAATTTTRRRARLSPNATAALRAHEKSLQTKRHPVKAWPRSNWLDSRLDSTLAEVRQSVPMPSSGPQPGRPSLAQAAQPRKALVALSLATWRQAACAANCTTAPGPSSRSACTNRSLCSTTSSWTICRASHTANWNAAKAHL